MQQLRAVYQNPIVKLAMRASCWYLSEVSRMLSLQQQQQQQQHLLSV